MYKQYTYARNLIQWNMDIFRNPKNEDDLRWQSQTERPIDEATEGYGIVPNFFISARMAPDLSYDDNIFETEKRVKTHMQSHFENRLFDRDTQLISHYDVNFLYIVSLYSRDNEDEKAEWRGKVRRLFRNQIRQMLHDRFDFFAMKAKNQQQAETFLRENFQEVLGKVSRPYANQQYFSLALDNYKALPGDSEAIKEEKAKKRMANDRLRERLSEAFYVEAVSLGQDPEERLGGYATQTGGSGISKKVLFVVDITDWDTVDGIEGVYISMESSPKAFEYFHEFADVDYILLTHRDHRTYLFKVNGKPTMLNKRPPKTLGRPFKKPAKESQKFQDGELFMVFPLRKEDIATEFAIDIDKVKTSGVPLEKGKDYYSPRVVDLQTLLKD